MAVLNRLPAQSVIDGYRGTLDFYVFLGLAVVRAWPRGKGLGMAPGTVAQQPNFTRVNRLKKYVSPTMRVAYDRYTQGGSNTWADQTITTYYGKNRPNDLPVPPSTNG